ncbi:MAG: rhamnogalacturonan acetylesterase [Candidatus Didemnitutus sp.]|nr:rhamnogalacturonan acetylesterase [Candidatus Didemnitutus sp.]
MALHTLVAALAFIAVASTVRAAPSAPRDFDLTSPDRIDAYSAANGAGFDLGTRPHGDAPFYFSVTAPEGNYRVTVVLGDAAAPAATLVRAESRRLMLETVKTAADEFATRSFIVNVRHAALPPPPANAPGACTVALKPREQGSFTWDGKLTLEFNGPAPRVRSIRLEPVDVPTVFLLGDSTVTDQRSDPAASWGQMLPRFLRADIALANHAESGETMKSFLAEGRLAKVLSLARRGDWMLIQFGHNDQKANWPQTYAEAHTTFRAYLKAFIAEARLRGVQPILVTSPERRTFGPDGKIRTTHGDYPAVVRAVAAEESRPCLDLRAASAAFYEALGPTRAPLAFNDGGKDATHHNSYGAYALAACIADAIKRDVPALAAHLAPDFAGFDAHTPPPPESLSFPASPTRTDEKIAGN